jgi:ATP-dependent DNA helicase RecG
LTDEQNAALDDVCADLASTMPMSRVLQGDVGSGKTVVALAAGAYVMSAGYSVVFMAPTEVLAQQHFVTASKYLKHPVFLLTSRTKKTELDRIKQAKGPCLTIGTHALVYTELPKFAFAIIDEQHKFGVQQRLRLRKDGVHALSMSATLIPRSLHLVLTGHLQTSILRQKPAQRSEVRTFVLEETGIEEVYRHIANVLRGGFLVYWVCPAISENSKMELASVEARAAELAHHFPGLVGVLHGKLASKTQVLQHFTSGVTPILLSTTVIEVGMDVHRATLIVVEQSERFGLAQLHQLRGRVGRGRWPGTCFLMHGTLVERGALDRLKFLSDCYDGFKIAEYDLRNRGYGDPLGSAQSGQVEFKFFSPEMGDLYDGTRSDEVERLLWGRDVGTVYGV